MASVLIVDGGNYCSSLDKVEQSLKHGEIVNHIKVAAEIERIFNLKFSTKFYFQGTQSTKPNDFHRDLGRPPPHGPHYNVEIFGKKKQNIIANRKEIASILVEEGVDVAVGTKIIECAYGIGKEQECDKIVVITGDGDLLRAIECADGKKRNTIHVIAARESLSNSLNRFVHVDRDTGCAVYLDEIMRRCVSVRERYETATVFNGNGQVANNAIMSQQNIFATAVQSHHRSNNNNNFNHSSSSKTSVLPLRLGAEAKITAVGSSSKKASEQNYYGPQSNPILFPNNTTSYDAHFPAFSIGSAPAAPAPWKVDTSRIQRQKSSAPTAAKMKAADDEFDRKHDNNVQRSAVTLSGGDNNENELDVREGNQRQQIAQGKRRGLGISQPFDNIDHKRPRPDNDTDNSTDAVWKSTTLALSNNSPFVSSDSSFPSSIVRNHSNSVTNERLGKHTRW